MSKWILINEKRKQLGFKILGKRCVKCGSTKNLEFDHKDPKTKEREISDLLHAPKEVFMKEIVKCQVLCRECHQTKSIYDGGKKPMTDHGTVTMYRHGRCRCDDCVKAHNKAMKEYRKKRGQ